LSKKTRSFGKRPAVGVLLDGFVVGVEGGFEEEDGGDAAGYFLRIIVA